MKFLNLQKTKKKEKTINYALLKTKPDFMSEEKWKQII